jgi:glycosyltransferase involved in cell wall biosynthesis
VAIVSGIFPPDVGGPATYVPRIASALVARGHHVAVYTLADRPDEDAPAYAFPVRRIRRSRAKVRRVPETVRGIAALARDSDVIFANGLWVESALAAGLTHTPLVVKIVGDWAWERSVRSGRIDDTIDDFQNTRYGWQIELLKQLRARVVRSADAVITPSQYLQRIVTGWGGDPRRLHVIYNAVDPEPETPFLPVLPPFSGYTVVTVGRLVPWKGIDRLLHVIAALPGVRLIVVGDGPEGLRLRDLAQELGLDARVLFIGEVPAAQVDGYLRTGDVFVLNSIYEGLPHVVLEALRAGVPVIATDVGGTGEIIEPGVNGLLVPPGDDERLRRALLQLLQQPSERSRLVGAGRRRIAEQFQWEHLVEQTERLLNSVARGG